MPTSTHQPDQVADALNRLSAVMEQLQVSYDANQRTNRRIQVALVIVVLSLLGGAGYLVMAPAARLVDHVMHLQPRWASVDPAAAEAKKQQLMQMLSPEERARVERYEKQVGWLQAYIHADPDFDAGATIAYFLATMTESMEVMPEMYAEVRAMSGDMHSIQNEMQSMNTLMSSLPALASNIQGMNGKMNALPVLAAEVQGMNAKMGIIAAGMDSTMGQAGRMFPFHW